MGEAESKGGWYYLRGGSEYGPVSTEDLIASLRSGELPPGVSVRREDEREYARANEIEALRPPAPVPETPVEETPAGTPAERRRRAALARYKKRNGGEAGRAPLPWATLGVIATNGIAFLLLLQQSGARGLYMPKPELLLEVGANSGIQTVLEGEYWRLFLCLFLHAGFAHFALNMFTFWMVGSRSERLYGWPLILAIYFASGFAGSLASLWWSPAVFSVGSSGAVLGVAGLLWVGSYANDDDESRKDLARIQMWMGIVIAAIFGMSFIQPGVDVAAHVGGLAFGCAAGEVLRFKGRPGSGWTWRPMVLGAAALAAFAGALVPLESRVADAPDVIRVRKRLAYVEMAEHAGPAFEAAAKAYLCLAMAIENQGPDRFLTMEETEAVLDQLHAARPHLLAWRSKDPELAEVCDEVLATLDQAVLNFELVRAYLGSRSPQGMHRVREAFEDFKKKLEAAAKSKTEFENRYLPRTDYLPW